MTLKEIAGVLLSDYYHVGRMNIWDVAGSLGEDEDTVWKAYDSIIVKLQMKRGHLRPFFDIESIKVRRLQWL